METVKTIQENMAYAIGTTYYIRHSLWRKMVITEGVQQLAFDTDCSWLINAIASYRRIEDFQSWQLFVNIEEKTAVLTMQEDSDEPLCVKQQIGYTDFPLKEVQFFCTVGYLPQENGSVEEVFVLMLPSEY